MSLPPKMPLGGTQNYFDFLKEKVSIDFEQQSSPDKKIVLNFEGLNQLLEMYNDINFEDAALCVNFSKAFNLWAMYVGSIKSITKKFWQDSKAIRIEQTAIASKNADEKSVANGDRCANKDQAVINARYRENSFESFYGSLSELEEFLIRCHYEVKLFCELSIDTESVLNTYSNVPIPLPSPTPLNNGQSTYLEYFVHIIKNDFKTYGVDLNFAGLTALCKDYLEIDYQNLNNCSRMSREFNMWSSYIDSLEGITKKLYLDAETNKTNQISVASFLHGGKNKSHGERLANMDANVIAARKTRNSFDSFHECLDALEQFLIRCHHETRFFAKTYNQKSAERTA